MNSDADIQLWRDYHLTFLISAFHYWDIISVLSEWFCILWLCYHCLISPLAYLLYFSYWQNFMFQAGMNGIKSNPQSFSKTSQFEMQHLHGHHHLEKEVEYLKSTTSSFGANRPHFLLREGDCDLSCCVEEEEEPCSSYSRVIIVAVSITAICPLILVIFIRFWIYSSVSQP